MYCCYAHLLRGLQRVIDRERFVAVRLEKTVSKYLKLCYAVSVNTLLRLARILSGQLFLFLKDLNLPFIVSGSRSFLFIREHRLLDVISGAECGRPLHFAVTDLIETRLNLI